MNRRRFPRESRPEQLETRTLMTVNVSLSNGVLKINGDNAGDRVDVDGRGGIGLVEVFVNSVKVSDFSGVQSIKANLKGGDDLLFLSAIQIAGDVNVKLGDGADELDLDENVNKGSGPDGILRIGGFLKATFGGDPKDFAEFDDGVQIGGDVAFLGVADVSLDGDGADFTNETNDIDIGGDLLITFSGHGDMNGNNTEMFLGDVNVLGETKFDGSNEVERLEIVDSSFGGKFEAELDDGNDAIFMNDDDQNQFRSAAIFDGGDDIDTLNELLDVLFAQSPIVDDFETVI